MKVLLVFVAIVAATTVCSDIDTPLLLDVIRETFPDEIQDQLLHELQHHGPNFDLSEELHDKIDQHVTLVKSLLPSLEAIRNFMDNFPDSKQSEAAGIIQEALVLAITETINAEPARAPNPNRRPLISPRRLQQILPEHLQRDILEELFLKGGLEHMSPELRRKVHEEMQRVRDHYVLPSAGRIEQFLQHFPPELQDELRHVMEHVQATGSLPTADDELRQKVSEFMDEPFFPGMKKKSRKNIDSDFHFFLDLLPNTIRDELQQIVTSTDKHIAPTTIDKIKLQLRDFLQEQTPVDKQTPN